MFDSDVYKSFNAKKVIQYIKINFSENLSELEARKIRYVVQKHSKENFSFLKNSLIKIIGKSIDLKIKLLLSQILKILIKQQCDFLSFDEFLQILKTIDNVTIKTEIFYAIAFKMQSDEILSDDRVKEFLKHTDDIKPEVFHFLKTPIKKKKSTFVKAQYGKINFKKDLQRENDLIMSKSLHRVREKIKLNNPSSNTLDFSDFINILNNIDIKENISLEALPNAPARQGSDVKWYHDTLASIRNIYRASLQGTAKSEDVDNYLTKKFLDINKCHYIEIHPIKAFLKSIEVDKSVKITHFFCTKMIISIFERESRKRCLSPIAFRKLLDCIISIEYLKKLIFDETSDSDLGTLFLQTWNQTWEESSELIEEILMLNREIFESYMIYNIPFELSTIINRINQLLYKELSCIRLKALKSIYNCIRKNKSLGANTKIFKQLVNDPDSDFKQYILRILIYIDEKSDYNETFMRCLESLKNYNSADDEFALCYVLEQSKDYLRSKDLFNLEILSSLINLTLQENYDTKFKISLFKIINNCLKYDFIDPLDDQLIDSITFLLKNDNESDDLKQNILISVYLSIGKQKENYFKNEVIEILVDLLSSESKKVQCISLIILENVCEFNQINSLYKVSNKLKEDTVIGVRDNKFFVEKRSNQNINDPSFSFIAAKIIHASILKKSTQNYEKMTKYNQLPSKIAISSRITNESILIHNLISSLDDNEVKTKILCAKCLSILPLNFYNEQHLNSLCEYINDIVTDVHIYVSLTYVKILLDVSNKQEPIHCSYFEYFNLIYVFNDQLNDLADDLNNYVIEILKNEASKQKLIECLFEIFDHVLEFDETRLFKCLEILKIYTEKKNMLPEKTICYIENNIENFSINNETSDHKYIKINLLKNIIRNHQPVSKKTLEIFSDNFFLSQSKKERIESFYLLDIVCTNQEMPPEILVNLELERAGLIISKQIEDDIYYALEYIIKKTKIAKKLPVDVFEAFLLSINDDKIISILLSVVQNGHILPESIISSLEEIYEKSPFQSKLIELYEKLIENNQRISQNLIQIMEKKLLKNTSIENKRILYFFLQLERKNIMVTTKTTLFILKNFLKSDDPDFKVELSSLFSSYMLFYNLLEHKSYSHLCFKIIFAGLKDDNETINLNTLNFLLNIEQLKKSSYYIKSSEKIFGLLIKKVSKKNCGETLKFQILNFLDVCSLNEEQSSIKNLCFLFHDKKSNSMDIILQNSNNYLYETTFNTLSQIIELENDDLKIKAIQILSSSKNLSDMPEFMFKSLSNILEISAKNDVFDACLNLLDKIALKKKEIPNFIIETLIHKRDFGDQSLLKVLKKINKNQQLSSLAKSYYKSSKGFTFSNKRLSTILQQLRNNIVLPFCIIESVLKLNKNTSDFDSFGELYSYIVIQYFEHHKIPNPNHVSSVIEEFICTRDYNNINLQAYKKIIEHGKFVNLQKVLEFLADELDELDNEMTQLQIKSLECISLGVSHLENLSSKCFLVLKNNLNNESSHIRRLCFKGLKKWPHEFQNICNELYQNLENQFSLKIDDEELIEIIISVDFLFDFKDLLSMPKQEIIIDILAFNLLTKLNATESEIFSFYFKWLQLMDNENFAKNDGLIHLLKLLSINDFKYLKVSDLDELFTFFNELHIECILRVLSSCQNPHRALKFEAIKISLQKFIKEVSIDYLNKLVTILCDEIETNICFALLEVMRALKVINNPLDLENIFKFIKEKNIKLIDIKNGKKDSISNFKKSLETCFIIRKIGPNVIDEIKQYVENLLEKKWNFDQLDHVLNKCLEATNQNIEKKNKKILTIFEILNNYQITQIDLETCIEVLNKPSEEWLHSFNQSIVKKYFKNLGHIKSNQELVNEFIQSNKIQLTIDEKKLLNILQEINTDNRGSIALKNGLCIGEWSESNIKEWAKIVKENKKEYKFDNIDFIIELISVIRRANFICTRFYFTNAQILSCVMSILLNNKRGTLQQVSTGEGKSTIICILAIIFALEGKNVDVITSSPVLAERDAKEKKFLYDMFDITCGHNVEKSVYKKDLKKCYNMNVVYGEASQFQFDTLRDEYSQLGTMGNRKREIAIVDEVDSMLIDDSSKIVRLASSLSGMDQLQQFYFYIWQRLLLLQKQIIGIEGQIYFVYGTLSIEGHKIGLELINDKGEVIEIEDLKEHLNKIGDLSGLGVKVENIEDYVKKHLKDYVNEIVEKKVIQYPKHLQEFVELQKLKWIESAITAYLYEENVHYIVHEDQIKPVDYFNTGLIQNSTNWSNGLHQFLQLKHFLKISSETLTTNFLSNVGYFKKYEKLHGLTGTLGSQKAKDILQSVYNMHLIIVPQQREKQFMEFPSIVLCDKSKWLNRLCESALNEASKKRGILIICETIEDTKMVYDYLKNKYLSSLIKLYTMNNMNQEKEIENIGQGEIFIATNLAGRGTDIKTDEIDQFGGLHVIIGFLPCNQRVEEQAFGRTARQGKKGTGQIIINQKNYAFSMESCKNLKNARDEIESEKLEDFLKNHLELIEIKDHLFVDFCQFLREKRKLFRSQIGFKDRLIDDIKNKFINVIHSVYEDCMVAAIEEEWALFIKKIEDGKILLKKANSCYKTLIMNLEKNIEKERFIKNPFLYIMIGNDFMLNNSILNDKYEKAIEYYNRAIQMDEEFSSAAYVGKAWCMLQGKKSFFAERDIKGHQHNLNYKYDAINAMEKAIDLINNEMAVVQSFQAILSRINPSLTNELGKQLIQKLNILGSFIGSIQQIVSTINKSLRLVDLTCFTCQNNSKVQKKFTCFGLEKKDKLIDLSRIQDLLEDNQLYSIQFNDLTFNNEDDQAMNTIDNIFPKNMQYANIQIISKQLDIDKAKLLLDDNIDVKNGVSKEMALKHLDESQSFLQKASFLPDALKTEDYFLDLKMTKAGSTIIKKNIRMKDAIKLIENEKNENALFYFKILQANKTGKLFQSLLESLDVEYSCLSLKRALEKIENIKSLEYEIEIFGEKENIAKVVEKVAVDQIEFYESKSNKTECFSKEKALIKFNEIKTNSLSVKLLAIKSQEIAKKVINLCNANCTFNIKFFNFDYTKLLNQLEDTTVNFYFNFTDPKDVLRIIKELREKNYEFGLVFSNLNLQQVKDYVSKSSIEQENIVLKSVKPIRELFMKDMVPEVELSEFEGRGIEYLMEISEKNFIPWKSIACVCLIGAVQISVGALLISTGFGATLGMGLITEGATDFITAFNAYTSREFRWSDYGKQKAISLTISAVSMGFSAFTSAGSGINLITNGIGKEAIETAGAKLIYKKALKDTVLQSGKSLKSLAFKNICVITGEAIAREGLNTAVNSISQLSLEQFKPKISDHIQDRVRLCFMHYQLLTLLKKLHTVDLIFNTSHMKNQVMKIIHETLSPNHNFLRRQWNSIGEPLCKGILSDQKYLGGSISMTMRIIGTIRGLHEITFIIEKIYDELVKKLSIFEKENFKIVQSLEKFCKIDTAESEKIVKILNDNNYINVFNITKDAYNNAFFYCETLNLELFKNQFSNFKGIISQYTQKNDKIIIFFSSFADGISSFNINENLNEIMKSVSDSITDQVLQITQSHLISPWSSYAIGKITAKVSNNIQNSIIQDELNSEIEQLNAELSKLDVKKDKTSEEINKIEELRADIQEKKELTRNKQTYSSLTYHHAEKFTVSYNQCKIIHFAQKNDKKNKNAKISKNVENAARAILNDKPADYATMYALAASKGIDLIIVHDVNFQPSADRIANGTQFIVFESNGNEIGHYTFLNSDPKRYSLESIVNDDYNCGYACIQQILQSNGIETSISNLRSDAALFAQENSETFSKALYAQDWIRKNHNRQAIGLLGIGGFKKRKIEEISKNESVPPILNSDQTSRLVDLINERVKFYEISEDEILEGYVRFNDSITGGSFSDVDKQNRGRIKQYDANHIPPSDSCRDTTLGENYNRNNRPCLLMKTEDHLKYISTGSSKESIEYRNELNSLLKENKVHEVFEIEIKNILKDRDWTIKYAKGLIEMINYAGRNFTFEKF